MATMYPTPLPASVVDDPLRRAEREVYAALRDQLDADHVVFYSVAWVSKKKSEGACDGEVDFIVAHPDKGVLLLEVKGGRVCHDGPTGRWVSVDGGGREHDIDDPYAQVRRSSHALLAKLAEHPAIGKAWLGLGHGVVLPGSRNPHRPLTPDGPLEITAFADDMDRLGDRVAAMFDYWAGDMARSAKPAPLLVATLTEIVAPTFELRQPLGTVLAG